MPFSQIKSRISNTQLGLWKVEEDELFFLERVKLYENEWIRLNRISHPQKRLEWLSSRLCLKELIKITDTTRVESLNNASGKPYLSNSNFHISYSHSGNYSTAIASQCNEVGVDIEYLGRKRNLRTRFLFMNEPELAWFDQVNTFEAFLLLWSSKETLYKILGEGHAFKDNIFLQPSGYVIGSEGVIPAVIKKDNQIAHYDVHYLVHEEFVLTYAINPHRRPSGSSPRIKSLVST
ncbi:MAG: 4'-phosphopantetheinyl transferase superfamily protein [Bacteroidota bacterium]